MNDIFISGYSGRFPDCSDINSLLEKLKTKTDCVGTSKRYPKGYLGLPDRAGHLPTIDKFDSLFFKMNKAHVEGMDIQIRTLLEVVYEALVDSDLSIDAINGTNTGVYVGNCFSDYHQGILQNIHNVNGYENLGSAMSMAANKISYFFGLTGPSIVIDTACSSSLHALSVACTDIESGKIDKAIVAGVSLNLRPVVSKVFQKYNMLSPDGTCYSFDENANGYCRSESINAIILQKGSGVVRIIGHGINANGTTEQGITFPNTEKQTELFRAVCDRFNIDKTQIEYIEAHGTGTTAGDNVEITALDAVYGSDNKCIHLGSIKSSLGHAEGASGLNSIIKCLLCYELGQLLPNIHYRSTKHKPITEGRFRVVTDTIPFGRGYSVVNNFGFGGTNAHIVLANGNCEFEATPSGEGQIKTVYARTYEQCENLLKSDFVDNRFFVRDDLVKFPFSGASIVGSDFATIEARTVLPKLAFIYSGQGCNYNHMAKELFDTSQVFVDTMIRLNQHLLEISDNKIKLLELFSDGDKWMDKRFSSIGITSVQIGLTNILFDLGYSEPDYIIGHSMGEIACSYADGCLTERQCIHISYIRSQLVELVDADSFFYNFRRKLDSPMPICVDGETYVYQVKKSESTEFETKNPDFCDKVDNHGRMLFISSTSENAVQYIESYPNVRIACYNSIDGLTLSGPHDDVLAIETTLKENKVFCKPVETDGIAYHSILLRPYFDYLMKQFSVVMSEPKMRSQRWLSTSDATNPLCDSLYHTTNIVGSVFFDQQIVLLPKDHPIVFLEISPNEGLLGQIKRTRKENMIPISTLSKKTINENSTDLKKMECYLWANKVLPNAIRLTKSKLPVEYRYKIRWDHTESWKTVTYKDFESGNSTIDVVYDVTQSGPYRFLLDHQIQGKSLFPAMGHLYTIWRVIGLSKRLSVTDFCIEKAIVIDSSMDAIRFNVRLTNDMNNNMCEIFYDSELVAKAKLGPDTDQYCPTRSARIGERVTNKHMFYGLLSRYGYEYKNTFCVIDHVTDVGSHIGSANHWISFLDGMLQTSVGSVNGLYLPTRIGRVVINRPDMVLDDQNVLVANRYIFTEDRDVVIYGLETTLAPAVVDTDESVRDAVEFIPYISDTVSDPLDICSQIVCENVYNISVLGVVGPDIDDRYANVKTMVIANSINYTHLEEYKKSDKMYDFVFGASLPLDDVYEQLSDGGFVLTESATAAAKMTLVARYNQYCLYRKLALDFEPLITNDIRSIDKTKSAIVTIVADGFVKTINKEPDTKTVICAYGTTPEDTDLAIANALRTQLRINIVSEHVCGSYRRVRRIATVPNTAEFEIRIERPGTLQTLTRYEIPKGDIDVRYVGLNFKDVMLSYGKLKVPPSTIQLGLEFSGRRSSDNRPVIGMGLGMFKTSIDSGKAICWSIPDDWDLKEAATIPCVYSTVYYALAHKCGWGHLPDSAATDSAAVPTVLIHAGAGGIGQTAIHVCLKRGLRVFTTCSENKRQFLKDKFGLHDNQIGNSRDNSFYDWIMDETGGEGVDIVLNSLADEKLRLSIDCVKAFGQFCEIGKYDILQNSPIGLKAMENNVSVHVIDLSTMFSNDRYKTILHSLLQDGIDRGEVVPLHIDRVFKQTELESAIRYMGSGNHIGKIVVDMDRPAAVSAADSAVVAAAVSAASPSPKPRFYTGGTHLITGGMGGFGIELGEWLIGCGAAKVLLMGRNGITNLYQQQKFKKYPQFKYVSGDITDESSVASVFEREAISGVWHLAMRLEDKLYNNMSSSDWTSVIDVKHKGATLLDRYCPEDALFVCWSSISSLFGNAGQTNYAQGNFMMEQICRRRKSSGKHGLAICWGAIDNIGYLAQENSKINQLMFVPQNIDDCLADLHELLGSKHAVVSCYKLNPKFGVDDAAEEQTMLEQILSILGLGTDSVSKMDEKTTLQQLGMDSLQSASVKQILKNNGKQFENIYNIRICDLN